MTIVEKVKEMKPVENARTVMLATIGGYVTAFETARDSIDRVIEKREDYIADMTKKGAKFEKTAQSKVSETRTDIEGKISEARGNVKSYAEARAEKIRSMIPAIPGVTAEAELSEEELRMVAMEKKLANLSRKVTMLTNKLDAVGTPVKAKKKAPAKKAATRKTAAKTATVKATTKATATKKAATEAPQAPAAGSKSAA